MENQVSGSRKIIGVALLQLGSCQLTMRCFHMGSRSFVHILYIGILSLRRYHSAFLVLNVKIFDWGSAKTELGFSVFNSEIAITPFCDPMQVQKPFIARHLSA